MKITKTAVAIATLTSALWAANVSVENPYVKEVAPNMKNSAAFMTIKNDSDKKITLVSATNDASSITELHTHLKKDGMMAMYKVKAIEIPAKGVAELKPMGLHVMLIGLNKQLKEGDTVNLELIFDNKETLKVSAPVKKFQGEMKPYVDTHK